MKTTSYFYTTDPDKAGYSLANAEYVWRPCLDAVRATSVVEVGSYRGKLTAALLDWAADSGAKVTAIEPEPLADLLQLCDDHPELDLVRETSHEALGHIEIPDVVILDGDHNYYTLSEELRMIAERTRDGEMPLVIFHDVHWPLARRDAYSAPERVPEQHRQPMAADVNLVPGEPGVAEHGLPFEWAALREGGPRNGVLTAIEDFLAERDDLRLATVPIFFGVGVLWPEEAPWSDELAEILEPWAGNPLLERLEETRVAQLVLRHAREQQLDQQREHYRRQEDLLEVMLQSGAFATAEHLSRLRQRGRPAFSREQVRRVLADDDGAPPPR
jgi:hypothetical protein